MDKLLEALGREWGLESFNTVEAYWMAEHGATVEDLEAYREVVNTMMANDNYGFPD